MNTLKKELFSGVFYTAIAKYSGIVLSLIITGVLSRLLSPDDFGIVAVASVIIAFFGIFTDMGISPAIVQKKNLSSEDLSGIFSFTIWIGVCLSLLFFLLSYPIGVYYENQTLITLCQLLSINLFFSSANIVPNSLFYKNKEFKFIAWRSLIIQTIGGTVAIIAAFSGAGLYALIINPIFSSLLLFFISIKKYPQKISLTLGIEPLRKIFSYSAYQFLFNTINYFSRNLDKLLIGKHMGMNPLGYYEKSYRLMMLPLQNITQVITPVMHPVFSDFQNDLKKLASSYERVIRLLAFIGFPASVLLYFTAEELILILFGDQWLPSIPVFQILTFSVGIQVVLSSSGSIFQAANDTRSLFVCGLFSATLNVTGILIGIFLFQTLNAVALCICITFTINFFQCYWRMYRTTFKRVQKYYLKQLVSPIILSIILFLILYIVSIFISDINFIISLGIKSIIYIFVFACYIQLSREFNIINFIKKKLHTHNK